jgi:hypothetical protein
VYVHTTQTFWRLLRESNLNIGLAQLALKQTVIDKFLYLSTLRKNNVHLFYRLITDHLKVWEIEASRKRPIGN